MNDEEDKKKLREKGEKVDKSHVELSIFPSQREGFKSNLERARFTST
jgi:hypothetical protein